MLSGCKEELNQIYTQVLKDKEELKKANQQTKETNIRKEVRDVTGQNSKFVKETLDMQKTVVFFGVQEDDKE